MGRMALLVGGVVSMLMVIDLSASLLPMFVKLTK